MNTQTKKADSKKLSLSNDAALSPEQYEQITRNNYYHPESKLILQLFLQVNYTCQLARKIQQKPSLIDTIDWALIERNTAKVISETKSKLLVGVTVQAPATPEASVKRGAKR